MKRILYFLKNPQYIFVAIFERIGWWIPDELYLRIVYYLHTSKRLHLNPPVTFNEKLQWLKLHDRKRQYTTLVDKYEVKKYVAKVIGEQYVIPTLGVWKSPEDINFDNLPEQFVLKTTHDGGNRGVILCNKKTLNIDEVKNQLYKSLKHNIYQTLREWPYKNINPRVMAEVYIQQKANYSDGLTDYKFFCFNGIPKFCQVKTHEKCNIYTDLFDLEWNLLPFNGLNSKHTHAKKTPCRPDRFELMLSFAKKLCGETYFTRVDFYNVSGRIYFGEITFYPASGMGEFIPSSYNDICGEWLVI